MISLLDKMKGERGVFSTSVPKIYIYTWKGCMYSMQIFDWMEDLFLKVEGTCTLEELQCYLHKIDVSLDYIASNGLLQLLHKRHKNI